MNLLGHPIEVWIVIAVAAIVKIMTKVTMGVVEALATIAVALGAGVSLYLPVTSMLGISPESNLSYLIACSIALVFENLARNLILRTEDPKALDKVVGAIWNRIVGRGKD